MLKYRLLDPKLVEAAKDMPIIIHGNRFDENGQLDLTPSPEPITKENIDAALAHHNRIETMEAVLARRDDPKANDRHDIERMSGSSIPTRPALPVEGVKQEAQQEQLLADGEGRDERDEE